jgi:hypothetical protein
MGGKDMDARESKEKFKRADDLFRQGEYLQALHQLSALNQAFPNTKNVMYPAALCLEKLGRYEDALPLCDQLIAQFQDPRAQELKDRITHLATPKPVDGLFDLDYSGVDASAIAGDFLDIPTTTLQYKPVEPEPIPWLKYTLMGLGVVAVLALIFVPLMTYEPPPPGTVGGYIALMLMRSLPYEDVWSNSFNISASVLVATLLESSFFGFILTIIWFAKAYDLGFVGLCFFYIFRIIFLIVGFFVGFLIFAGSLALALNDVVGN